MTEETRTTRLTILIAGNAFVLSKSYDLIVSAIKATHFSSRISSRLYFLDCTSIYWDDSCVFSTST